MLTHLTILNMINALLEMLECSLLFIHTLLYALEYLLEVIKLRSDSSLILIHVLLHRVKRVSWTKANSSILVLRELI